jgi:hypothetical protein
MKTVGLLVASLVLIAAFAGPAAAIVQFQKEFWNEYVESNPDKEYGDFVKKKAKCWVCHQGKKSRKNRNSYGQALSELLDFKKDTRDKEKIVAALKKVADMPSDPLNTQSETFGARISAGKLPAGELDDLLKEPAPSTAE